MTAPTLRSSRIYVENPQVTFVRNLKKLLERYKKQTGKTVADFRRESGIPKMTLYFYQTGQRWPRPEHLQRLASELGVPVEMFFRR